jgi:hypothetical protein
MATLPQGIEDPVKDFWGHAKESPAEPGGELDSSISAVRMDFNGDGQRDIALTRPGMGGSGGRIWFLYIQREDGRYNEVGSVFTVGTRFRLVHARGGEGRLAVMSRGGSGYVGIQWYDVSPFYLKERRLEHTSQTRIDAVFGPGYTGQPEKEYTAEALRAKYSRR